MNKATIKLKSQKRFMKAMRVVEASAEDMLQKAISMSPQERDKFIFDFLSEHGLRGAINVVANISKVFKSMDINPDTQVVQAQLYEGLKKPVPAQQDTRDRTSKPGTTDVKTVLNKLGDWSALLTFFCMLGAAGTSDYVGLVKKSPDTSAEIKSFLIFAGAAFMTWAIKYMASKWKAK